MEITVIVTLFNDENIVNRLVNLNLVNLEKHQDLEVIFIDDCSSDSTVEILKTSLNSLSLEYRIFINKENLGVSACRNYGIETSKGKYIAFLDSDDLWHVDKIDMQRDLIIQTGADVVATNAYYLSYDQIDANSLKIPVSSVFQKVSFLPSLFKTPFVTPSVFLLKSALSEDRFPISMRYAEDFNLWLRLIYKLKVVKLKANLVHVVTTEASPLNSGLSESLYEMHKGIKYTLKSYIKNSYPLYIRIASLIAFFFEFLRFLSRLLRK
jgi:teichuronic acid biosynthesis glycosyltransferase TuaG